MKQPIMKQKKKTECRITKEDIEKVEKSKILWTEQASIRKSERS